MKIDSRIDIKGIISLISVRQIIFSIISNNIINKEIIKDKQKDLEGFSQNRNEGLENLINIVSNDPNKIIEIFHNPEEICKFLCYLGLYCDLNEDNLLNSNSENTKIFYFLISKVVGNVYNDSEIIAILKILKSFIKNDQYFEHLFSINLQEFFSKLIVSSSKYLRNPFFLHSFIEHCMVFLNSIGIVESFKELHEYFTEEIYPYLTDFYDYFNTNLFQGESSHSLNELIFISKEIVVRMLKSDTSKASTSIKSLTNQVSRSMTIV